MKQLEQGENRASVALEYIGDTIKIIDCSECEKTNILKRSCRKCVSSVTSMVKEKSGI